MMKRKEKIEVVAKLLGMLWVGQQPSKAEVHYMATVIIDELKKAKNK